ncbi:MAG TPA: hypothetical protein VK906_12505 [Egicoccus sp.]|nr:hypothetical protein [Egicoccus sp.]HSK23996.1 hypothetical protein [Egicoccus sp.]
MDLRLDRRGTLWGLLAVALTLVLVVLGSSGLTWFDAALIGYLFGTLFAIFGVAYRYTVWLQRPPTARLNKRGWELLWKPGARTRNLTALPGLIVSKLFIQDFIFKRSKLRWLAHQLIFWGCILAALVTFPLTFGWLHFRSAGPTGEDAARYTMWLADFPTISFDPRGFFGFLVIHALNISAVLVLAGVFLFLGRRLRDPAALAVERSSDLLPLAGLFAVSVTGMALTVSNMFLEGRFYAFLTTTHALTVILGLMYIPFGKLFHIFQRPANLGVAYYKREGAEGAQALCASCGQPWAAQMQVDDLKQVLPQVGFDYSTADGGNYQDNCPRCRRRMVALAQSSGVGGFG